MYTDKTRNVAIVLGVKDVKSDIKDKNRLSFALQTGLPTLLLYISTPTYMYITKLITLLLCLKKNCVC